MKTSKLQKVFFLFLLFFGTAILAFSFVKQSQNQVNKALGSTGPMLLQAEPTSAPPIHSNYVLPHPGILPTNPLYPFKMIRDRIGLMLTTDPKEKTELLLHYADKRIAAADMLLTINQINKSIETATKAELYLFQAINSTHQIAPDTLKNAALKHKEVLKRIYLNTQGSGKDQINRLLENLNNYQPAPPQSSPSAIPATEPYL